MFTNKYVRSFAVALTLSACVAPTQTVKAYLYYHIPLIAACEYLKPAVNSIYRELSGVEPRYTIKTEYKKNRREIFKNSFKLADAGELCEYGLIAATGGSNLLILCRFLTNVSYNNILAPLAKRLMPKKNEKLEQAQAFFDKYKGILRAEIQNSIQAGIDTATETKAQRLLKAAEQLGRPVVKAVMVLIIAFGIKAIYSALLLW